MQSGVTKTIYGVPVETLQAFRRLTTERKVKKAEETSARTMLKVQSLIINGIVTPVTHPWRTMVYQRLLSHATPLIQLFVGKQKNIDKGTGPKLTWILELRHSIPLLPKSTITKESKQAQDGTDEFWITISFPENSILYKKVQFMVTNESFRDQVYDTLDVDVRLLDDLDESSESSCGSGEDFSDLSDIE